MTLIQKEPTAKFMDELFSLPDSSPSPSPPLVKFDHVSKLVLGDMSIDSKTGKLNPTRYAIIANAITLGKLSLLNNNGLKELISSVGYKGNTNILTPNIMFRFASNIDGNQSWLANPPPYPRANGMTKAAEFSGQTIPKSGYGYIDGAMFWKGDLKLRNNIFRKLFVGPLVPNLVVEAGDHSPFQTTQNYPYRPTKDCPFPSLEGEAVDRCPVGWLNSIKDWFATFKY